jgi:hypothetical protein
MWGKELISNVLRRWKSLIQTVSTMADAVDDSDLLKWSPNLHQEMNIIRRRDSKESI